MVSRRQARWIISHEIRHNHADSSLFVIQHDWCATFRAGAQLERPIWILVVEWPTVQAFEVVDFQVAVVEEDDMSRILPSNPFTDGAVASVIVYRIVI